ncbi:MAG: hypothetical protein ACLTEH_00860 [Clostridia bacterium]
MYDANALKRKIHKEGIDSVMNFLLGDLDDSVRDSLTKANVFIDGYLNMSLIYSLA